MSAIDRAAQALRTQVAVDEARFDATPVDELDGLLAEAHVIDGVVLRLDGRPESIARAVFASLDVDALARGIDPEAFEEHASESWSPLASLQWAARRKIALDHADAAKAHLLDPTTKETH